MKIKARVSGVSGYYITIEKGAPVLGNKSGGAREKILALLTEDGVEASRPYDVYINVATVDGIKHVSCPATDEYDTYLIRGYLAALYQLTPHHRLRNESPASVRKKILRVVSHGYKHGCKRKTLMENANIRNLGAGYALLDDCIEYLIRSEEIVRISSSSGTKYILPKYMEVKNAKI